MNRLAVTLTVEELRVLIRDELRALSPVAAPAPAPGEYLTPTRAAADMGVHPRTLRLWVRSGELAAIRVGRGLRVTRSELERFAAARRVNVKLAGDTETEAESEAWARNVVDLAARKQRR